MNRSNSLQVLYRITVLKGFLSFIDTIFKIFVGKQRYKKHLHGHIYWRNP